MRRFQVLALLLLAACTSSEVGPDATLGLAVTTTTVSEVASTSAPGVDTTGAAPESTTTAPGAPPTGGRLAYELVADLPFPVEMTARPGDSRGYVITKNGVVWRFEDGVIADGLVMDISDRVRNQGEQGLLAIALHPTDVARFYLHYTAGDGDTVVSEFSFDNPERADPDSERVLLRLDQPAGNHNGGMLQFHDDLLYLGLGDGGGANDQFGNGQNRDTLLGGIVAIDVETDTAPALYMYGLRNPWRFWIDGEIIYIADVGQNSYEEINVAEMAPDQNFGWPITEGLHCFRPPSGCDASGIQLPQVEITHGDAGTCSVTGGLVYRGEEIPELEGAYLYSDYCGGYLRSFRWSGEVGDLRDWTDQVGVPGRVTGFGVDGAGEVYVMTTEEMLRLVAVR